MCCCFIGTGTNLCYMEELKNIEKTQPQTGQKESEVDECYSASVFR